MGISTGVFDRSRGVWPNLVSNASSVSTYVVELSALSGDELPGLIAYLRTKLRLRFRYASVHAPVKDLDEATVVSQLDELPLWVRSIVTHPDAVWELGPYRRLGTRLVMENMDDRKGTGRIADEIEPFFEELPEAGFCLDVAHAWSIDPTMGVASELLIVSARGYGRFTSARSAAVTTCRSGNRISSWLPTCWIVAVMCRGSSKPSRLSAGALN
jgi:hypothetical protein